MPDTNPLTFNIGSPIGRYFVIGDIHGCINTLRKLINQLSPEQSDQIIFLGDYVNKGPDSLAVIEEIISLTDKFSVFCLLGNHDKLLLDVLVNDSDKILRNKLSELTNDDFFKLSTKDKIRIKNFLQSLPYYYSTKDFLFVHAGFNTESTHPFEERQPMLNIRDFKYDPKIYKGKKIVHGHNPKPINKIKNAITARSPIIPLDNGCVYKEKYPELGRLLCLELNKMELISQQNCD